MTLSFWRKSKAKIEIENKSAQIDWPPSDAIVLSQPILALDFETSGLDAPKDQILSIGYVSILNGSIDLSTAREILVKQPQNQKELGSEIHGLGHDQLSLGVTLHEALSQLLNDMNGHILLAHNSIIETQFLRRALGSANQGLKDWPVIDTLAIEKARLSQSNQHTMALRLSHLRQRYNLPHYPLHNALTDAISAAEVFLAQLAYGSAGVNSKIRPYLKRASSFF